MKLLWIRALILICLVGFAGTSAIARGLNDSQKQPDPIDIILAKYVEKGYTPLGPIQYLGKTNTHIKLYTHKPVPYNRLRVINTLGKTTQVKEEGFIYLLLKGEDAVIIPFERKGGDNA